MSFRPYIKIEGREEKVYERFEQLGEYLCDICGEIMERGSQAHLTVEGTLFQGGDPLRIKSIPLDLHLSAECITACGSKVFPKIAAARSNVIAETAKL